MTIVHLERIPVEGAVWPVLVGRVYYGGKSFEAGDPFDAVFLVIAKGGGKARAMAAHGKISIRAYGIAARMLLDQYGITDVDMRRHGREILVDSDRASGFSDL